MAVGDRIDPYLAYNFLVEIDGATVAGFNEVDGISSEIEAVEYREGKDAMHPRKLSGMRKFGNITLKNGFTVNDDLHRWFLAGLTGPVDRRSGSIILMNEEEQQVVRWNFREGWPTKFEGPPFNAASAEVAILSVELVVEEIEVVYLA
jgi:phage tail-like protein